MSFNSYKKPKLVESKLAKYYIDKIIEKKNNKIIQDNLEINKDIVVLDEPLHNKIIDYLYNCITKMGVYIQGAIIDNYGFILIVSLLIILLYVRYIEVNNRKIKMKKVIDKIKENDLDNFDDSDASNDSEI